jgi:hypothetical protein
VHFYCRPTYRYREYKCLPRNLNTALEVHSVSVLQCCHPGLNVQIPRLSVTSYWRQASAHLTKTNSSTRQMKTEIEKRCTWHTDRSFKAVKGTQLLSNRRAPVHANWTVFCVNTEGTNGLELHQLSVHLLSQLQTNWFRFMWAVPSWLGLQNSFFSEVRCFR